MNMTNPIQLLRDFRKWRKGHMKALQKYNLKKTLITIVTAPIMGLLLTAMGVLLICLVPFWGSFFTIKNKRDKYLSGQRVKLRIVREYNGETGKYVLRETQEADPECV